MAINPHGQGRDAEGRGVFVFNIGRIDTRQGSLEQFQKMGAYLVERFTREVRTVAIIAHWVSPGVCRRMGAERRD